VSLGLLAQPLRGAFGPVRLHRVQDDPQRDDGHDDRGIQDVANARRDHARDEENEDEGIREEAEEPGDRCAPAVCGDLVGTDRREPPASLVARQN
jgi:hypothetical protein